MSARLSLKVWLMANTIFFADGSSEICCRRETEDKIAFFEQLLSEKLGSDAARFFKVLFIEWEEEYENRERESKEFDDDGYLAMCHDACDDFKSILDTLKAPRLNRNRLRELAQRGYENLYNNL